MLIDDEEEKKKRLEEAMQITNNINSNNYQNDYSTNNTNSDDEYTQRLQEAMNITNSINPYAEETSSDIDISPDLDTSTIDNTIQNEEQTENKKKVEIFKDSKALDDGYQFGDISRSAIATVTDVANRLAEGFSSPFESVVDIGAHAVATIQSLTGHEEASKKTREWADKDVIKEVAESNPYTPVKAFYNFASGNGTYWENMQRQQVQKIREKQDEGKELNSYEKNQLDLLGKLYPETDNKTPKNYKDESMLGETSGQVVELIGYTGGLAAGTQLLGGAGNIPVAIGNTTLNLPTLAVVGGAAGGLKEADSKGENVSEIERWSKAITGGLIEGTTEGLFGMFGVGGTELTDIWASKAASKMSTGAGKILAKLGVQATGEATEEFLSYAGNYIIDNALIDRLGDTDFSTKWDWGEVGEQMALAFVSSAISLGGESYISTNQSIKTAEEQLGRELTPQEKTSVIKAITEDALIKYDNKELFEDGEESVGNYFVANYDENGEVGEVVETLGKAIENPNTDLDIQPVIIKDQQNKTFNVIDGQTGMLLDTTPYTSVQEAVDGFTEIVTNMSEAQIESVNNNVADSTLALYAEIGKMIQERQSQNITSQNQQNNTIEQNNIQGQEINNKNNKNAQNGFSNQIKTTMEQRTFENVSDKNVKSYQTENPEVSQEIQEMAYNFQEDLANSTFGERYKAGDEWTGTKRSTTKELAEIKDDTGASWGKIQKALEDISQGKGDYALAKKVELVLDKALSEGYKNIYGKNIMPNESYLTKKGKIEGKNYLQNETETSIEIESNPEENRIFGERINKKGGNSNVRSEQNTSKNTRQKINRTAEGENTRGESKNAKGNELVKNSQSKGLSNYQRQQQRTQGKDFKAKLVESKSQSPNERIVSEGFKQLTGLDLNVYKTNKATTENAFFSDSDVYLKHNSLANKKTTNFLPFHELGHWFKVNRTAEWNTIHDIIDNTITKNQIEEYKNVLNNKSIFDNMSEAEIREYVIEEIESDYFGNWANDISNWENMLDIMPIEYQNLLADISLENISTHFNIFGTQEQQEQVYNKINEMMNNFIVENKNGLKTNSENNTKYSFRNDTQEGQYWQIEDSKDLFKGITTTKALQDKAYKYILNGNTNFETITDKIDGKDVKFIRISASEYVYGRNNKKLQGKQYQEKMRTAPSIDDLINNAEVTYHSPLTHKNKLFPNGYNNYQGKVGIDNDIFRYIVRVGKTKNNESIFYDISLELLKQKNRSDNKVLGTNNSSSLKSTSTNSIAQKNKTVKSTTTATNSNMQKSKDNTIKKSDRIDTNVVATDNQGRQLSKEQQEYFRDSKVRDENGKLKVVYHGTDADFTVFDYRNLGKNGTSNGKGFYFTDQQEVASQYSDGSNIIKAYVNIQKPLRNTRSAISQEQYIKLAEAINDKTNGLYFTDMGDGTPVKKGSVEYNRIIDDLKHDYAFGGDDVDLITGILNSANLKLEEGYRVLRETLGYDGIIGEVPYRNSRGDWTSYKLYIAFTPEQIKNVDNTNPTTNPDIRYSNRYDTEENGEGGFYSQLEKVIEEKMPNTSNAQQIKGIIENSGIKQDEIKWIGLDDYLKQHSLEKITKQQLQDYIKANQINLVTVKKGDRNIEELTAPIKEDIQYKIQAIKRIQDKYHIDYEESDDDIYYYKPNGLSAGTIGDYMADTLKRFVNLDDPELFERQEDGSYLSSYTTDGVKWQSGITEEVLENDMQELEDLYDELHEAQMNLSMVEDEYSDDADEIGKPKYKQYALEGGTNYQEILYTVPAIEKLDNSKYEVKNLAVANVSEYQSPHWHEKNVLAHVRTQDFKDTSENKVLFIDEIQSDLHQEGRKKGYSTQQDLDTIDKLNDQLNTLKATYSAYEDEARNLSNKGFSAAREYYTEHHNKAIDNLSHLEKEFKINEKLTQKQQYELLDYENEIADYLSKLNRENNNFRENIESEPYMMTKIKEAEKELNLTLSKDILEKQSQKTIYRKRALENFKVEYYDYGNLSNLVWGKWVRKYLSAEDQQRYTFLDNETDKLADQRVALQKEIDKYKIGIPDIFPFKKNWHEFVLRRMINNAVEQGYDEVAWTTGKQQRERYSLSKAIDSLRYKKFFDSSDNVTQVAIVGIKNNEEIFDKRIYLKEENLEDYIGKDLANKILKSKKEAATINNLDANIDSNTNNGMYVFYDQEIPNYLNKYLKKWNSKVEEITLLDADGKLESKQMGFKITDEMRNSIKQNGQPLFSNRQLDEEEASTYDERIQRKNRELIKELREQKENIQGLEGYSRTEIKDIVSNYIQDKLVENDLEDISINGAEIIGSRNRGNAKTNSDLDLVVEYSGDIREDDLFNILNEEPLEIEGIKVDINPITSDNTGTLEEYLERSKQYDKEILSKENIRKEDVSLTPGATNAQGADRFIEQEIRKIETSGNWDNSIPVTKLTDIRKTIEDYLGLGIKKGHFRERAYGIYKEGRDVIRGKELKDIDNILHETGHALDLGNRLKIDKNTLSSELLTAVKKHGGYENETRSVQLDEGFAEIIRAYGIIPEQTKIDYPQTVAVLEEIRKADKSFDDFIRKVQQQTYNYIHQNPQNRVHSNISVGESNRTPLTKAWLEQEVMRNVWDKDYAVKKVVSEIAKIGGKTTNQIKASNNAYYLTRLATGIHDKVTSMLSDGYINEKGEKIMPGLNKVGEILGDDAQRYNDLRDYLVARRDTDYKAKTLKTGIRDMDTKYVLEKFANDTQIKDAAQVVYDTLDGVMQYAVDNGLINEDDVKSLKESNAFYVPMQRVIEGRGNQLGRKGAVSDIIKARTGSELDIKDVLENIVSNSTNIIQQVENNNVLRALYNQGEEAGLTGSIYDVIPAPMMKVGTANLSMWENELKKQGVDTTELDLEKTVDIFAPNNKIDTKNLITSFIDTNGKRVYLQFNDEILFNSLMNLDGKMMSNVLKINSKLNMPLRYGATMANIGFAIPNMISDTAQAAIFSNAGFIPVVDNALGVLDILTATNKHVKNFVKNYSPEYVNRIENMYNLYIQSGATSSTRMSQFRDSTQSNMKDIYGTKNSETLGIHEKWKPLKRLLDIMTYIPEISEQSTRFRVFERNYDMYKSKGNSEMDARILAALESRDATQDFGRTGNLTREINQLIPFSAARVGSSYTFAEKVKANPKRTAMRIAILSAIALAIKAIGYDDKEIEELIQRKKDDNFVMRVGDNIVTIKKPQGILRSIVNLTEYIEDLTTGHIEEGKEGERLGEWINNAIMDNAPADSVTGLVPNMVAPLIENAINKDLYYNTDIVKSYDLELPDSQQYYEYNSQLAILLGKVFNYSPAKIDNLISGYFAGLGTQVTNIMDYASGKLGITAQKAEMGAESNAVGKRFIVNVNSNSASVDEIYNRKTELTKKKNGGTITSEEETELSNITAAVTNMSKVNKQIKEIKRNLTMSGKEKAEQIKELQRQRTDIARKALGKDLLDDTNSERIETTSFYPTNSSLSLNKLTLELTPEMKEEYSKLASEFYKKYEKQGLYSQDKLKQIKTKAKDYAKKTLMKKYKSQLVKSK